MADPNSVKSIFLAASEKPAAERAAFLDEAVGDDTVLRARVEALLNAHDNPDGFLEDPAAEFGATIDLSPAEPPLAERPGTLIGPYKLLEQIGEGGMGVVYMADQQAPVRRRVALKVIKAGMDTRQVIARFEAERQALALMDHSNIARVLDAGATDSGRPYFVMELVRGIPITEYCDQNNLPVHERLELFVQVCSAVQHAHQKGIIHRDLKPSNVLVTLNDGRAVPKVIDFGVAKATGQQLTEKTLFTAFAQMVGTPLYMSPEQAEMTSLDIDTRSDIYSLGVLVYELLTGTTPFDQQRMRAAAFDEIRRIIREEEPPKPSTRISTLGESRTATAAHRQVDAHRLGRLVKGDLDWIVMKCLEKDRTRRYETATGLAEDIHRYLTELPVKAGRPTRSYRLKKFIRRNRLAVISAGALSALLIAFVAILVLTNYRIRRESAAKDEALIMASQAVDQMLVRVANYKLANVPLALPLRQALLQDALSFYEELLARQETSALVQAAAAEVFLDAAVVQRSLGRGKDALRSNERAINALQTLVTTNPDNPVHFERLAYAEQSMGDTCHIVKTGLEYSEDEAHYQRATEIFAILEKRWPERSQPVIRCLRNLGFYANERRDPAEAERLWREAIHKGELYLEKAFDDIDARTQLCWVYADLGYLLAEISSTDRTVEAETVYQAGIRYADLLLKQNTNAEDSRDVAAFLKSRLGMLYIKKGMPELAIELFDYATREYEHLCESAPSSGHYWASQRAFGQQLLDSLRQTKRLDEAKTAVHRMKDWLGRIKPHVSKEPELQLQFLQSNYQVIVFLYDNGSDREKAEIKALAQAQLDVVDKLLSRLKSAGESDENQQARKQLAWMLTEVVNKSQAHPALREPLLPRALALHSDLANELPGEPRHLEETGHSYRRLGWLVRDKGQFGEAKQCFEKAADTFEKLAADEIPQRDGFYRAYQVDSLLDLTHVLAAIDAKAAAVVAQRSVDACQALTKEYPGNLQYQQRLTSSLSLLAERLAATGQNDEAETARQSVMKIWETHLAKQPKDQQAREQLASTLGDAANGLQGQSNRDLRERLLRRALALRDELDATIVSDQAIIDSRLNRTQLHTRLGEWNEAIDLLEQARALTKENDKPQRDKIAAAYVELCFAAFNQQKFDILESAARKAIEFQPDHSDAHFWLGIALTNLGKQEEAIAALRKAIELKPGDFGHYRSLSLALWRHGKLDEAINAIRKAIELQPDHGDLYVRLGSILIQQGKMEEGVVAFDKAIALNPADANILNQLAWFLATAPESQHRDLPRAVELAKKGVDLAPNDGAIWNTLGVAQYHAGDWQAAIDGLQKAMDLRNGGDASDWFFLAMAHWQLDQKDEARTWYDKAVEWMDKKQPKNEELLRFRAEAAKLLGISEPAKSTDTATQP